MANYIMVINRHKCVGCGACNFGCKIENNVGDGLSWAKVETITKGKFPDVTFEHITTLCNHCDNAPCVKACPTVAMYKTDDGLTLHNPNKCIGCQSCVVACPYGMISFNKVSADKKWTSSSTLIKKCTTSGKEVAKKSGEKIPFYNPERHTKRYPGIRGRGLVEKCTFCDHRIVNNKDPYCVEVCPSKARVFGDLSDPKSNVSKLLKKYPSEVLKPEKGTDPRVYYIRNYQV